MYGRLSEMKVPAYVTVTHLRFRLHPFDTAAFPREAHPGSQRQHVGIGMQAVILLNVGVTFYRAKGRFPVSDFVSRSEGRQESLKLRGVGQLGRDGGPDR